MCLEGDRPLGGETKHRRPSAIVYRRDYRCNPPENLGHWEDFNGHTLESCPGQTWFCVTVKPNAEIKFAKFCASSQIPFFCPILPRREKSGFEKFTSRVLWRGYVFCRLDVSSKTFLKRLSFVRAVELVSDEHEVLEKLKEVNELLKKGNFFSGQYHEGDIVRITQGPLRDVKAIVESILPGNERIALVINTDKFLSRIVVDASSVREPGRLELVKRADEIAFEKIRLAFEPINSELMGHLAKHPEFLHKLNSFRFEILVAELLRDMGYDVHLTPRTRDGGRDILAVFKTPQAEFLIIVDCKRFALKRKIGPELVHRLLWVSDNYDKASYAIMATTTYFTSGAREIEKAFRWRLGLKDFDAVKGWVANYGKWTIRKSSGLWIPNREAL